MAVAPRSLSAAAAIALPGVLPWRLIGQAAPAT